MNEATGDWTLGIRFEEEGTRTVAVVTLRAGDRRMEARGSARRNPVDPSVPRVGEDLALARALSHLAHELLGDAARQLEAVTHAPAGIHG